MTQIIWNNSKQEVLYYDGENARTDWPCSVRLQDGLIEVSYEDDEGNMVRYRGTELGPGHFKLESGEADGTATLHAFEGSRILEGYWCEGTFRRMWRILLASTKES